MNIIRNARRNATLKRNSIAMIQYGMLNKQETNFLVTKDSNAELDNQLKATVSTNKNSKIRLKKLSLEALINYHILIIIKIYIIFINKINILILFIIFYTL